ncbi:hypothetical protein TRFO_07678 [Tritrichomonas foetus]|uniref:Uncharacterized protein n=1 Tax=Tritrichomonas foetus TaxID=1144522 RepID=A0A1J4JU24_9EUKA|nr:hypothetical protein TRFO_07678 [Tritrichomonas foetus]|eukprot:OHT01012.1 hypothetical protein TRFO_07678 [Tritrichomonas foetus]
MNLDYKTNEYSTKMNILTLDNLHNKENAKLIDEDFLNNVIFLVSEFQNAIELSNFTKTSQLSSLLIQIFKKKDFYFTNEIFSIFQDFLNFLINSLNEMSSIEMSSQIIEIIILLLSQNDEFNVSQLSSFNFFNFLYTCFLPASNNTILVLRLTSAILRDNFDAFENFVKFDFINFIFSNFDNFSKDLKAISCKIIIDAIQINDNFRETELDLLTNPEFVEFIEDKMFDFENQSFFILNLIKTALEFGYSSEKLYIYPNLLVKVKDIESVSKILEILKIIFQKNEEEETIFTFQWEFFAPIVNKVYQNSTDKNYFHSNIFTESNFNGNSQKENNQNESIQNDFNADNLNHDSINFDCFIAKNIYENDFHSYEDSLNNEIILAACELITSIFQRSRELTVNCITKNVNIVEFLLYLVSEKNYKIKEAALKALATLSNNNFISVLMETNYISMLVEFLEASETSFIKIVINSLLLLVFYAEEGNETSKIIKNHFVEADLLERVDCVLSNESLDAEIHKLLLVLFHHASNLYE